VRRARKSKHRRREGAEQTPAESTRSEIVAGIQEILRERQAQPRSVERTSIKGLPPYDPDAHGPLVRPASVEGYRPLEEYWVNEPFARVSILHDPRLNRRMYYLSEPEVGRGGLRLLRRIMEFIKSRVPLERGNLGEEELLARKTVEFLNITKTRASLPMIYKLFYYVKRDALGFKRVDALMRDPQIEDISCNGLNVPVYIYHRRYFSLPTNIVFTDEEELNGLVIYLVERCGKTISFGKPTVDGTLPDGSRLQATLGTEITTRGSTFTIRKFAKEPFTPVHLIEYGTYTPEMLAYLWLATENRNNILIIGETASGKTSTLNALALFIPPDSKIISLEETRELTFYQENWVPSVTRSTIGEGGGITLYDLLLQALRQRPECVVVGEIRGKEALTLFQAMSTGHTCYSTLHASNIEEAINRLEGPPLSIPHNMLGALDIACFQSTVHIGKKRVRRVTSIVEILGIDLETNSLKVQELYRWVPERDEFEQLASSAKLMEIAERRGVPYERVKEELRNRARVLEFLHRHRVIDHERFSAFMRLYHTSPEEVMSYILSESEKGGSDSR
jgi:flagellar protein FlaI